MASPIMAVFGDTLRYAELTLTAQQLKALKASPREIVSLPGDGLINVGLAAVAFVTAGTSPLAINLGKFGFAYHGRAIEEGGLPQFDVTELIDSTADVWQFALAPTSPPGDGINHLRDDCENLAIEIANQGAAEFSGNLENDAVIRLALWFATLRPAW